MYISCSNDMTKPHSVLESLQKSDYFYVSTQALPFSAIAWMEHCFGRECMRLSVS